MEIAGFLTFLGLLIAAYSILKTHERLFIRLRLSLIDKVVIPILVIIILLVIIVSDHIRDYDKEIILSNIKFQLSFIIPALAYFSLLLISAYIYTKVRLNRLSRRKLKLFGKLVTELLNKNEYPTLLEILDEELERLIRYSSNLSWHQNIKHKLLSFFCLRLEFNPSPELMERAKKALEEIGESIAIDDEKLTRKQGILKLLENISICLRHNIGKFLRLFIQKDRDRSQERSKILLHALLSNNDFMYEMISIKPELGIKLFEKEFPNYYEYVDIFFYEMMRNNKSILYYEIRNNENVCDYHRYVIQDENMILSYLFKKCKVAQRLQVYSGVGKFVLDHLLDLNKQDIDLYNLGYENFKDERWKSPIFMGIRFFDIMISEAIYQGIEWHMWLFCFRHLTKRILKNFEYIPEVWEENLDEWKTKYTYLLYEIVHTLCGWIENIRYEKFNYKVDLQSDDCTHENSNIIKSSILCLIQVLDIIARDMKLPVEFKEEQADRIIELLFELKTSESEVALRYGNVIFNCIKHHMKFPMKFNKRFYNILKAAYDKFDKTHYVGPLGHKGRQLDQEFKEYLLSL